MQFRNPCKKCLVRPTCKKESYYCDKVKKYRSFKEKRFALLVGILIFGVVVNFGIRLSFQIHKFPDNIMIEINLKGK